MRKLARLSLVAGASMAVLGGAMVAGPTFAAGPGGGECQLNGTANFHPGPGADPQGAFAYDFGGTLSGCNSNIAGAPASGTISAGQPISVGGATYQEPTATGTGSCATGTTAGTAIVNWVDGTVSVIDYTTTSGAAGVVLQGTVVPSVTVTSPTGNATVATTRFLGDGAAGVLAFEVTNPTQCTAAGGVTSAGIQGATGIGAAS